MLKSLEKAMNFDSVIGIDYSGAETPNSRLQGLAVYKSIHGAEPQKVITPDACPYGPKNWSRQGIAEWLVEQLKTERVFVGIDHCFSLPDEWFELQSLPNWYEMLRHFPLWWPTHKPNVYVDFTLDRDDSLAPGGTPDQLRITETWTSSAKSVFQFKCQGAVGKSSWAGIPWLAYIREQAGDLVHFWPFDGWQPAEGKSVIAEVYPSIFRRRYPAEGCNSHEQDAYAVARWLSEMCMSGRLTRYLEPPLNAEQKRIAAEREGWILGVM